MRVINIIIHNNKTGIQSIESFGVYDEQDSATPTEQAESVFSDKIKAINPQLSDDEIESVIEDGYFELDGQWVSIVWSHLI